VFFTRGAWVFAGIAALLSPLILYRVIEDMNGRRVSFGTSIKLGLRGIIPAAILGAVRLGLSMIPLGAIIGLGLVCYWFVVAPAAVAERLGPGGAIKRSSELTAGRRWPIFGMLFLMGIAQAVVLLAVAMPLLSGHETDPQVVAHALKRAVIIFVVLVAISEMFTGIVQAVSYALLRADKDGVSTEELAKVFE